jgi:outer membrane protein
MVAGVQAHELEVVLMFTAFLRWGWLVSLWVLLAGRPAVADAPSSGWAHWSGDVGLADYVTANWVGAAAGARPNSTVLPYLFGETGSLVPASTAQDFSGALFARVDTFGVKTWPVAWGHVELAARLSMEGETSPGLTPRRNPMPLGVGTFQETPWGGVFFNAFHDAVSGGQLLDFNYVAEFKLQGVSLYPQLGGQWRSARYVNHLVGVSAQESRNGPWSAYSPGAATTPVLAMAVQMPLERLGLALEEPSAWSLLFEWRRRWADAAMAQSPLVHNRALNDGLLALVRSFD